MRKINVNIVLKIKEAMG